ncbi:MAG: ATP-binding domain-containing protein [Chloroflexi bacterium]|nr:ATP-binding domain-containing protein [Chloroflexota bacterium]
MVGDEDQSIYGFRFADYRHVKGLQRAFPDHDLVFLEQNYRSKSGIVSAGQKLIEHNRDRAKKKLWTDNPGPSVVDTVLCYDQIEEAKAVADLIEAQIENRTQANEIAVLYRTHALSRAVETVLVRRKIPYQMARGVAFYERLEVRDVLAWLWVLFNGDTQKFARIANRPKRRIGPKTVELIVNAASDLTEWMRVYHTAGLALDAQSARPMEWKAHALEHNIKVGGGMAEKIWRLSQTVAHLKQVAEGGSVPEVVDGVIQVLRPYWETFENTDERLENAMELFTVAQTIRATGEQGLQQFLDQVSLVTQGDDVDGEAELVTLATIHAVKGLEYDVVIIVGVEEGLIPHERSSGEEEMAEERRLLYVAVTRARRAVYLSHTIARTLFGVTRCNPPSLFLEEMGLHLSI